MPTMWKSFRPLQDKQYIGEYQLFDGHRIRPGFVKVQWQGRTYNDIAQLVKPAADVERENWWCVVEPSDSLLRRLFPTTKGYSVTNYELLYCIQSTAQMPAWRNKGATILKGVLKDKRTNTIVLLTSHSVKPSLKSVPSVSDGWYVLTADTIAPPLLWSYFS